MYYRALFLCSVVLGVVYDWIFTEYLGKFDGVVCVFVVSAMSLIVVTAKIFYGSYHTINLRQIWSVGNAVALSVILDLGAVPVVLVLAFELLRTRLFPMTLVRSFVTVISLIFTFDSFSDANIAQITSSYYAIPVGDFLFTTIFRSMGYRKFLNSGLSAALLIVLLCKDLITRNVESYTLLSVIGLLIIFLVFRFKSDKTPIINVGFVLFSVGVLFMYDCKPLAILGSFILSFADILMQRYSNSNLISEMFTFLIGCIVVCLGILWFQNGAISLNWLSVSSFPMAISLNEWKWFGICSLISIINQIIWLICFANSSLIKFIPLRYIDLVFANAIRRNWLMCAVSLGMSFTFMYLI